MAQMVEAWRQGCIHTSSLVDFWESMGRPPAKTSFLWAAWMVGPPLILWNLWLEWNHRIFHESNLESQHLWIIILSRLQETISTKCDMSESVDPGDLVTVQNLNLGESSVVPP